MPINIETNVILCDFHMYSVHLSFFPKCEKWKEAFHYSLTSPDISQQEAGGEHGQEKVGQSAERVKDPRSGGPGQLHHHSTPTCWEGHTKKQFQGERPSKESDVPTISHLKICNNIYI